MITIELKPWPSGPDTHTQLLVKAGRHHFTWLETNNCKAQLNRMAIAMATNHMNQVQQLMEGLVANQS